MQLHFTYALIVTECVRFVTLYTKSDYENLRYKLFINQSYDKKILPRLNSSVPIDVDVNLYFLGIDEIDEVTEKMVLTGYLEIIWTDPGLVWDPLKYGGVHKIFVPQNDIWKPDIFLVNGFKKFTELGGPFYYIEVDHEGGVSWVPFEVFESRCSLDTKYFPFDGQSCSIMFSVWTHSVEEVKIRQSKKGIIYDRSYQENSVWTVVSTDYMVDEDALDSNILFTFYIERKPLYYITNIILPIVFLGFLNGLVFVIPAESGEKIGYSVTIFLSLVVFITIIGTLLPVNSVSVSVLGVYLVLQVAMGVVIIVISTVQLRLHHRGPDIPVRGVFLRLGRIRKPYCTTTKVDSIANEDVLPENKKCSELSWSEVVMSLDFICFWTFIVIYILITCLTFLILILRFT